LVILHIGEPLKNYRGLDLDSIPGIRALAAKLLQLPTLVAHTIIHGVAVEEERKVL